MIDAHEIDPAAHKSAPKDVDPAMLGSTLLVGSELVEVGDHEKPEGFSTPSKPDNPHHGRAARINLSPGPPGFRLILSYVYTDSEGRAIDVIVRQNQYNELETVDRVLLFAGKFSGVSFLGSGTARDALHRGVRLAEGEIFPTDDEIAKLITIEDKTSVQLTDAGEKRLKQLTDRSKVNKTNRRKTVRSSQPGSDIVPASIEAGTEQIAKSKSVIVKDALREIGGSIVPSNGISVSEQFADLCRQQLGAITKKEINSLYVKMTKTDPEIIKISFKNGYQGKPRVAYLGLIETADDPILETQLMVANLRNLTNEFHALARLHGMSVTTEIQAYRSLIAEMGETEWTDGTFADLVKYKHRLLEAMRSLAQQNRKIKHTYRPAMSQRRGIAR